MSIHRFFFTEHLLSLHSGLVDLAQGPCVSGLCLSGSCGFVWIWRREPICHADLERRSRSTQTSPSKSEWKQDQWGQRDVGRSDGSPSGKSSGKRSTLLAVRKRPPNGRGLRWTPYLHHRCFNGRTCQVKINQNNKYIKVVLVLFLCIHSF